CTMTRTTGRNDWLAAEPMLQPRFQRRDRQRRAYHARRQESEVGLVQSAAPPRRGFSVSSGEVVEPRQCTYSPLWLLTANFADIRTLAAAFFFQIADGRGQAWFKCKLSLSGLD